MSTRAGIPGVAAPVKHDGPGLYTVARYRMLVEAMRPKQWSKNAFVLAGVVFSGRIIEGDAVLRALIAFSAFCAISSAAYLLNDLRDRETDRLNARTAGRPLSRGDIGPRTAMTGTVLLATFALAAAAALGWSTLAVLAGYGALQVAYSTVLKHVLFVDVMTIAAGFVLRALAGLVAIDAVLSPWLLLATGMLALFLALGKRRAELVALANRSASQRRVLEHYTVGLVDELIAVITPSIVMIYALYCVLGAPNDAALITLPYVIYGIFRVLYLIHHDSQASEDPSVLAIHDRPLRICILAWGATAAVVMLISY